MQRPLMRNTSENGFQSNRQSDSPHLDSKLDPTQTNSVAFLKYSAKSYRLALISNTRRS